jgi:hypothetical protein
MSWKFRGQHINFYSRVINTRNFAGKTKNNFLFLDFFEMKVWHETMSFVNFRHSEFAGVSQDIKTLSLWQTSLLNAPKTVMIKIYNLLWNPQVKF